MTDRVGQRLGNYRLVRMIGQGGFAEVYLGQHIYLDTLAAIKILHARLESDDIEYFLTEARTVARLLHPNIVRVLEFNVEDFDTVPGDRLCPQRQFAQTPCQGNSFASRDYSELYQAGCCSLTVCSRAESHSPRY